MTLLPQTARHGILVDLEVCFNLKVDPQSPSYTQNKEAKQFDGNGSIATLTEASLTLHYSDNDGTAGEEKNSPAQAYSDKKAKRD
mmetsp:Transcript_13362/g.16951  ORF Transcript_13362/g.16951 Transcript_13362/m.16951 type:complete len:85 (-) Transcript_13362:1539-1793(-)|eukprot:CAMPEP_0170456420 /NCGR_PEP_ID=MMETSP0123-20130129/4061_1 /TAXON_ID=182087 /ORGANISM="Favella ehrenbergii, Strain Fehren 1" /LENGTH=84 /DNA_ID=CAMNT_0010719893 /DNA_START=3276 /DNA_END=3530 /DNA_ORIENTATION=+